MQQSQLQNLSGCIKAWALELGFQQIGISDIELSVAEKHLQSWLQQGFHGDMEWMARHGTKRSQPDKLVAGTLRIISVRMDYYPEDFSLAKNLLQQPEQAVISRYALGRDYHKVMRQRLKVLAGKIEEVVESFGYRIFVDSAPVLEKPIAEKAGLGWIGKHTNVLNRESGSWFFLGEIYTDLPLTIDNPAENHCGTCQSCIDVCPTQAIVAPYTLDARRCISYLTIEHKGAIAVEFRAAMGNRIYGCDDCQQVCPWNRFAQQTTEPDFAPRHQLDDVTLLKLFNWTESEFLQHTEGSAIRRIGYERWQRNLAIALGNCLAARPDQSNATITASLKSRLETATPMVREHIEWALIQSKSQSKL